MTDHQRSLVEANYGYAVRSARNLAASWGRSKDADEFISVALLAMTQCVTSYRPERGKLTDHFTGAFRRLARAIPRRLSCHGLVASSSNGSGDSAWRMIPMAPTGDVNECPANEEWTVDIDDAISSLEERHRSVIERLISGKQCKDAAAERGVSKTSEHKRVVKARAALLKAMGEQE